MRDVTIGEELTGLRGSLPGCEVVAFADLSTGMVLASSTSSRHAQEKLDALCDAGRDALSGPLAQDVSRAFGIDDAVVFQMAFLGDERGIMCFVRARRPAEEALCFVLSPDAPLEGLQCLAVAMLSRLASEA
ncbi:MAG: hypothetical protein AAGF27_07055 [Pseudomonadota bacterium]